jgi:hypothetical protein
MEPQLGAFMVVKTGGWPAWWIRRITRSSVNHAAIYVGHGQVIEGRPQGAGYCDVDAYPQAIWSSMQLTDQQRVRIVGYAYKHMGAPYSWLDCLAIGLAKVTGKKLAPFIRARLSRPDRLMCSQLVDLTYTEAGVPLFSDGRLAGDVSPGDLLELIEQQH